MSIDLLKNFGVFDFIDVQEDVVIQCLLADKYASDNLDWSGKYLLNSISASLYQDVLKRVLVNLSGPEVLLAIQACAGRYIYDTMEKVKVKLNAIKLSDYPGANVQAMNIAIKVKCDQLDSTGYWKKDMLHVIAKKYKAAK
eukprot:2113974-Ditylum_brightwellii.AAC.1